MAPIPITPASKATEEQKVAFNKAVTEAFRELRQWTESHGPLHREKGANMRGGVDMVDHSDPLRPLSRLGVIGIAVEKLKQLDRLLESVSRQPVGKLHLASRCSPPTEGIGAKPEPSAGVTPQAGRAVQTTQAAQTGTSKQDAIVITASTERNQPANTILVSGDYLFRLERENHLLRTHLVHFEQGIVGRLENGLKQIVQRHSSSTPPPSNVQGGDAGKEGTARVQGEDTTTQTGNSGLPAVAASRQRSLKLILKLTPTFLKAVGDGQGSGPKKKRAAVRKRAREASDGTVVGSGATPGVFEGARVGNLKSRKLE